MAKAVKKSHMGMIIISVLVLIIIIALVVYGAILMMVSRRSQVNVADNTIAIPEIGIKLSFSSMPNDLYYVKSSSNNNEYRFSTENIKSIDSSCSAEANPSFYLEYTNNPSSPALGESNPPGPTILEAYPAGVTIDGIYYYVRNSNGPCSDNADAVKAQQDLASQTKSIIIEKL